MSNKGKKPIFTPSTIFLSKKKNFLILSNTIQNIKLKVKISLPLTIQFSSLNKSKIGLVNLYIDPVKDTKKIKQMWSTLKTQILSSVYGLYRFHQIQFKLIGVGFKGTLKKNILTFRLGYSHRLFLTQPKTLNITKIKKRPPTFLFKSYDFDIIQNTASLLRSFKKPEPYKGKGILFLTENIKLKEGKTTK